MIRRYTIRYVYGSYSGTYTLDVREDQVDDVDVIATMWARLRPHMSLGMASRSARIINVETVSEDE